MREILFRGKRGNQWVLGSLIQVENFCCILGEDDGSDKDYPYLDGDLGVIDGQATPVIPETIGQYTGLTDKNGKKIFEGDILAFSDRLVYVRWHDYCGCWDCSYIKAIEGKPTLHEDRSPNKWRYNAEIIGNIHDNPELLEER